jgi:hypothetical protein
MTDHLVDHALLQLISAGWRPHLRQMDINGSRLLSRGLLRLDYGPQGTADQGELCWYLTERGRKEGARITALDERRKRRSPLK